MTPTFTSGRSATQQSGIIDLTRDDTLPPSTEPKLNGFPPYSGKNHFPALNGLPNAYPTPRASLDGAEDKEGPPRKKIRLAQAPHSSYNAFMTWLAEKQANRTPLKEVFGLKSAGTGGPPPTIPTRHGAASDGDNKDLARPVQTEAGRTPQSVSYPHQSHLKAPSLQAPVPSHPAPTPAHQALHRAQSPLKAPGLDTPGLTQQAARRNKSLSKDLGLEASHLAQQVPLLKHSPVPPPHTAVAVDRNTLERNALRRNVDPLWRGIEPNVDSGLETLPTSSPQSRSPPRTPVQQQRPTQAPKNRFAPTSPQNFRTRAHARAWQSNKHTGAELEDTESQPQTKSSWFSLDHRPYLPAAQRAEIVQGTESLIKVDKSTLSTPAVFHVGFTQEEVTALYRLVRKSFNVDSTARSPGKHLAKLARKDRRGIASKVASDPEFASELRHRRREDVENYLTDLASRAASTHEPRILAVKNDELDQYGEFVRASRIPSLLQARELAGWNGYGSMRRLDNFANEFRKCREDDLEMRAEWANCAGDISTITWVSNDGFLCGTTTHSDAHNQQYNKPGNLALGSCSLGTLRAYPDHRIVRPIVDKGDNATDAMRQSQDPWLYSSVVSSDYDHVHDRAYTSSFDGTVKVWTVEKSGKSMDLLGTWAHTGHVNFVVCSRHDSPMVATAADVPSMAVRVYNVDPTNVSGSQYRTYACSKVLDLEGNPIPTEKWAYFPATIQWGRSPEVTHMLLVGYSPRCLTNDEDDIPDDKRDSGEVCLWDGLTGERVKVTSATAQNVFEVAWHPTQPSFIAATSPHGDGIEDNVRTQIRIFRPTHTPELGHVYQEVKTLDCPAIDINELTVMPNSFSFCYVTAGCTDGNTYVWDTASGDKPIHVLSHGYPLDEFIGERDREDTGVKFTAWGTSPDRFYTGGSDGVVKVWNVRSFKNPLVRDLIEVPASVSYGMFSPDCSKLIVGDASGHVFFLSVDEDDIPKASFINLPFPAGQRRKVRQTKSLIPHPEPAPPALDANSRPLDRDSGITKARAYLERGQLKRHEDPTVGVAQGENYAETGLFRREAHMDDDPSKPLLAEFEVRQQEGRKIYRPRRKKDFMLLRGVRETTPGAEEAHARNRAGDLDWDALPAETRSNLQRDRVMGEEVMEPDFGFGYEEMPSWEVL